MSKGEKVIPFPEGNRNEALRRIREAAETGQTALDLGDLGLDSLPRELGDLTGLRRLSLGRAVPFPDGEERVEWWTKLERPKATFTDLTPLATLTNLEALDLSYAIRLQDLSPLSGLTCLKQLRLNACRSLTGLAPLIRLSGLYQLDLESLAIWDLTQLGQLTHLNILNLGGCKAVYDLEPLAGLKGLTFLRLNQSSILDLRPLSGLTHLTHLDLGQCSYVSKTAPLASLVHLVDLKLANCEQIADFSFLAELHELERLSLSDCHLLFDLNPLASLDRLTHLDISGCSQVTSLEPLTGMSDLASLDLGGCTGITSFASLYGLKQLQVLWGQNTNLAVPEYLISSGDAQSILAWLRGTVVGVGARLAEIKLLLLGQGRVGKSHLRRRITGEASYDYYDGRLEPTQNIDCADCTATLSQGHPIRQSSLRIRVWDFGGQNHLHSAHRFFLGSERCFYVLVIAADRPANGEGPESNRLNYWLRMIARYSCTARGERAPVVIAITRSDEPSAIANRQSLEDALQAAERHDWFGAQVVRVIRGMGWSQSLNPATDVAIWNQHKAAIDEMVTSIDDHLDQVPAIQALVPMACHKAKEFVETIFSTTGPRHDYHHRPYLLVDELNAVEAMVDVPSGPMQEEQRRGLRYAALGLLNCLGAAHWVGNTPEVVRSNPWGIKDLVFNPEWVKRPVYDLLWRSAPREAQAGFLSDRQVQDVLVVRSGNPRGTDLYERMPFTEEDRGRVLELMKACRLIFDSPHEPGILVPDLLETARLTDVEVSQKGWRYSADFLPEKVMLRFIAEQYRSIDTRIGECFRNLVVWKRGEQSIILESHFSPPGGTRPYLLIRPVSADEEVSESVAANVGLLLDEIFVDEGLGDVRRELAPDVEGRLDGKFVFRRLPMPVRRGEIVKPKFSIVFDGVDLGFDWDHLNGLEYLHVLIRQPGEPCHVQTLSSATTSDNRNDYRIKQNTVERKQESSGEPNTGRRLAKHHPKKLKELLKTLEAKLANTEDEEERQTFAQQIEDIVHELERRNSPAMTKLMRTTQQSLKRSIGELKAKMREKGIPEADLGHFDHCGSSEGHPFHFCYRPAFPVKWETE